MQTVSLEDAICIQNKTVPEGYIKRQELIKKGLWDGKWSRRFNLKSRIINKEAYYLIDDLVKIQPNLYRSLVNRIGTNKHKKEWRDKKKEIALKYIADGTILSKDKYAKVMYLYMLNIKRRGRCSIFIPTRQSHHVKRLNDKYNWKLRYMNYIKDGQEGLLVFKG